MSSGKRPRADIADCALELRTEAGERVHKCQVMKSDLNASRVLRELARYRKSEDIIIVPGAKRTECLDFIRCAVSETGGTCSVRRSGSFAVYPLEPTDTPLLLQLFKLAETLELPKLRDLIAGALCDWLMRQEGDVEPPSTDGFPSLQSLAADCLASHATSTMLLFHGYPPSTVSAVVEAEARLARRSIESLFTERLTGKT